MPLDARAVCHPATPASLWRDASRLGQACREKGCKASSLDLLIAVIAVHHEVELIYFDKGFTEISRHTSLQTHHLLRPT